MRAILNNLVTAMKDRGMDVTGKIIIMVLFIVYEFIIYTRVCSKW